MKLHLVIALVAACTPARSEPAQKADKLEKQDFQQHIAALKQRMSKLKLKATMLVVEPFVVVGDGTATELEQDAGTVRWATKHLEADFGMTRPTKILDIYLFRSADSYEHGVEVLTGEAPTTPYGFYSKTHDGLFMNIATGGGTLVHELVHPYIEADFPNAPPWLNEGLGSLFEQSAERDGHIVGLTNWRLAGLQRAIAKHTTPTIQALTHLGANEFYGDDSGVNYAMSRYLLYYVQQAGRLREFYRQFRAARDQDPSGYKTFATTLGEKDIAAFTARWEKFVSALEFP